MLLRIKQEVILVVMLCYYHNMSIEAEMSFLPAPPLGPLAGLAARAQEWRTRDTGLGTTWAGLWHPSHQDEILATIAQHAVRMDTMTLKRLARRGALPGVRDYSLLWAILPTEPAPTAEQVGCVDNTTQKEEVPSDIDAQMTKDTNDEDADATIAGIPIWNHGVLSQAKLTPVRHAVHLMRHLDDYHEPTLAAQRRQRLRKLVDAQGEERLQACQEVAETFLAQPTRWRDVVETAVHLAAVRTCELHLGQRIKGPSRTKEQLFVKLETGLAALAMGGAAAIADQLCTQFQMRLERLEAAKVVLMYEEQQYLQLSGIRDGRSVRRHLPRGLHLVFSDQQHRREDRTAGLWLEQSDEERRAGPYHFANQVPPAYAARRQRDYFRLPDAAAVRRYVENKPKNDVVQITQHKNGCVHLNWNVSVLPLRYLSTFSFTMVYHQMHDRYVGTQSGVTLCWG
jgi:hypothetical protein